MANILQSRRLLQTSSFDCPTKALKSFRTSSSCCWTKASRCVEIRPTTALRSLRNSRFDGQIRGSQTLDTSLGAPTKESEFAFDTNILTSFMESFSHDISKPIRSRDHDLEKHLTHVLEAEIIEEPYRTRIMKHVQLAAAAAYLFYPEHPFEVKAFIAKYVAVFFYIEDAVDENLLPELQCFSAKLLSGEPFQDPNLAYAVKLLTLEMPEHFGAYGTGAVLCSSLLYMNASLIESTYPKGLSVPRSSARFPLFLRSRTGNSEAFCHFLFPAAMFPEQEFLEKYLPVIPDLLSLVDLVQDILSFYKEAVVGTEGNIYFLNTSRTLSCSPVKVLQETCDRMVTVQDEIRATLKSNDQNLATALENFYSGYITWHLSQEERYRLHELGLRVRPL